MKFYISRLVSRKHLLLICVGIGAGIGVALAFLSSPKYHSKARLLFDVEASIKELNISAGNPTAVMQLSLIREIILRRDTVLLLADKLGLSSLSEMDAVYQNMHRRISVKISADRNTPPVMTIGFEAKSAEAAANGAKELVKMVLQQDENIRSLRAYRNLSFRRSESRRIKRDLDKKILVILRFKNENKDTLPENLALHRLELTTQRKRLSQIAKQIEIEKRRQVSIGLPPQNFEIPSDKGNLYIPTLNQPPMVERRPNDALTSLESLFNKVSNEVNRLIQLIETTIYNTIHLENLEQALINKGIQARQATTNLTNAESAEQIAASEYGQRLSIFEPAQLPTQVSGFNRPLIILTSTIGGLIVGLLSIIALELSIKVIRRPQDLIDVLGVTPISTLPYVPARKVQV